MNASAANPATAHIPPGTGENPLVEATLRRFWETLNPDLSITGYPLAGLAQAVSAFPVDTATHGYCMRREGYFQLPPIIPVERAQRLARLIKDLTARKIPPVFAMVYDECWAIYAALDPLLSDLLGEDYLIVPPDIWGWQVDPAEGKTGWGPHRDLPEATLLREDGSPRVINVWMPLTDATPLNACMYVMPAHLDPNLPDTLDGNEFGLPDWQNIRALPAAAGSALAWNTQVMHWGGRSSAMAPESRISLGVYFQSADVDLQAVNYDRGRENCGSLRFDATLHLPFERRLRAIAGAIYLYNRRVPKDFPDVWEAVFDFARAQRALDPAGANQA